MPSRPAMKESASSMRSVKPALWPFAAASMTRKITDSVALSIFRGLWHRVPSRSMTVVLPQPFSGEVMARRGVCWN